MNGKGQETISFEEAKELQGLIENIFFPMWQETEMPTEETRIVAKKFADLTGAKWNSPLAIGFTMFVAGVNKGLEVAEDLHAQRGQK